MVELTEIVSEDVAEILNNRIYSDAKYAAEDLVCTMDNFIGAHKYKRGELIDYLEDNIHGEYYCAPTYAEVIDYLWSKYKIVIELRPVFTMATKTHVAFFYKAYKVNEENSSLDLYLDGGNSWFASINYILEEILEKVL